MKIIKEDVKTAFRGEDMEKKGNDFSLERRKRNVGKVAKVIKEVGDLNAKPNSLPRLNLSLSKLHLTLLELDGLVGDRAVSETCQISV